MDVKIFFKESIKKSIGCTEPAAIGLSVSIAFHSIKGKISSWLNKEYLKTSEVKFKSDLSIDDVTKVIVKLDKDTYRNALQVVIPYAEGIKGCVNAAILGLFCNPDKELELFKDLANKKVLESKILMDKKKVEIVVNYEWENLHIETELITKMYKSTVKIIEKHSNVVCIKINDKFLFKKDEMTFEEESPLDKLIKLNLIDLIKIVEYLPDDSKEKLEESIKVNYQAFKDAKKKFKEIKAKSIGLTLKKIIDLNNIINSAKYKVVTAIEGRMAGFPLEIMTCAGSGNMGLISTLTLIELHDKYDKNQEKLIRALGLTHLIANYVSKYLGSLSALCGCTIKAGIGLAAGIAYYLIENDMNEKEKERIIGSAINSMIGSITGIICDGAKRSCALKAATAVDAAITSAFLSLNGIIALNNEGIMNENPLLSIKNISKISKGMIETDKIIIKEILEKIPL